MNTLKTFVLAVSATAMLGTTGLHAQTRAVADVPFGFTVQTVAMPPGKYAITPVTSSNNVILIQNLKTGKFVVTQALSALSTHRDKDGNSAQLVFHHYGNKYFFSEVWTPGGMQGGVAPDKLERETRNRANNQLASTVVPLAAGTR